MKQTKAQFKCALRQCKRQTRTIFADRLADSMHRKNDTDFWKDIHNTTNSAIKLPNVVDTVQGNGIIIFMWKTYYESLFNVIGNSRCDLCNDDSIEYEPSMATTVHEMASIINDLPNNKSAGPDGISSEHFKYAGVKLRVLLSLLISAILVHGYVPEEMLTSVIIPLVKDKNKRISDKANYRPICLSNVFNKLFENVLLVRILPYLETTCNQFGFKPKHGTEMCVFVLKELISYYVKHGSGMFVAYLDASKAFDRVNHATMFNKMLVRGVPKFIVKLLSHWYCNQQLFARWGAVCSNVFFSK